jgi:hypothetical protein
MKSDDKSRRLRERMRLSLPVRVYCRETLEREWTEMTRLLDVTPFGAAFSLAHPTEPGRLLQLTMAMPRQLRCYDHVEMQYSVWSLVRHIQLLTAEEGKGGGAASKATGLRFSVGVAFIGKRAPASYDKDPTTRYEVAPNPSANGLWEIRERTEEASQSAVSRSKDTRLQLPVEVVVEVLDEQGNVEAREETVTENISRRGAAVWTTLDIGRGRFVRLTGVRAQLSVFAAVRACRSGADGILRLHLEFIDRQWPLEGVE